MRLLRHLADAPYDALAGGSIVTIGTYDGLHLGHQQLLKTLTEEASEYGLPSVVMSFEPTPKEYFSGDHPPARLMRFREKYAALTDYGIDFYCPRFNKHMREMSADDFVRRILIHGLNARHIVVGDDFHYARRQEGNIDHLRQLSAVLKFDVDQIASIDVDGVRASSSTIRDALWSGDLPWAAALLGRPYRMSGKIVHGEQLGRKLGFPTANIDLHRLQSAVMGVFAVRVSGLPCGPKEGVASVGSRPTFNGTKIVLEVFIFDFDDDIYGEYMHVDFVSRLRGQEKFSRIDDLVAQMHLDVDNAKQALAADASQKDSE